MVPTFAHPVTAMTKADIDFEFLHSEPVMNLMESGIISGDGELIWCDAEFRTAVKELYDNSPRLYDLLDERFPSWREGDSSDED